MTIHGLFIAAVVTSSAISVGCVYPKDAKEKLASMKAEDYFDDSASRGLVAAVIQADDDMVASAIRDGADVNVVGRDGMTPLMWAIIKDSPRGFGLLVKNGADVSVAAFRKVEAGKSPSVAELASGAENPSFLREMLANGADPNQKCRAIDGTLIFAAVWHRRTESLRLLVDAGADIEIRNKQRETPVQMANSTGDYEMMWQLVEAGADIDLRDAFDNRLVDQVMNPQRQIDPAQKPWYDKVIAELEKRGLTAKP